MFPLLRGLRGRWSEGTEQTAISALQLHPTCPYILVFPLSPVPCCPSTFPCPSPPNYIHAEVVKEKSWAMDTVLPDCNSVPSTCVLYLSSYYLSLGSGWTLHFNKAKILTLGFYFYNLCQKEFWHISFFFHFSEKKELGCSDHIRII